MPASATTVVTPAFEHTIQQLFKPFRLGQWTRLAVTGLLAGELGGLSGMSSGLQLPSIPRNADGSQFLAQALPIANVLFIVLAGLLIMLGAVLFVLFIYVSSIMRFVLFDSVMAKECHIRRFWNARQEPGFRYFVFQLLFSLSLFGSVAILAGTAGVLGFVFGWFRNPAQHVVALVLAGIVFFFAFAALLITALVVMVLTKDFVVPQMAIEDINVTEGWRRLWPMLKMEKGAYAAYMGLKILLAIGAGVMLGIAVLLFVVVLLIPFGITGVVAVLGGRAFGLTWNLYTIALAIVAGVSALAVGLYGLLLMSVPAIVFFPAYSIYFFAARYPALNARIEAG
jgi:hypothetical protein